jgi:hypothetical protein
MDVLRAAIEFQQAMIDANRDQPEKKAIVFREQSKPSECIFSGSLTLYHL